MFAGMCAHIVAAVDCESAFYPLFGLGVCSVAVVSVVAVVAVVCI
jgi:hypothetical protein